MSDAKTDANQPRAGLITWTDLTVENADEVRDFYAAVVGWKPDPVSMGDYSDYSMNTPDGGTTVAGICHARGVNQGIPPQWLVHIQVEDLDASIEACRENGGALLTTVRDLGQAGRYCVIRDPAGAVAGLFESPA